MSGFKLIGITPLSSCDSKFSKNLEIGKTYQFYSGYDVDISEDLSKVLSVTPNNESNIDLYKLKNGIDLNISAVVGKNGTGKSTIFELLYYTIYAISTDKSNGKLKVLNTKLADLQLEYKIAEEDYHWIRNCLQVQSKNAKGEDLNEFEKNIYELDYKDPFLIAIELQNKYKLQINKKKVKDPESFIESIKAYLIDNVLRKLIASINEEKKWESFFRKNFACSILYESEGIIREISYANSSFKYSEFYPFRKIKTIDVNQFDFKNFFYSISLNFSHHGLNSKILGKWINKLFHKNDAYITPVVISPMRDEGNFDINHELNLSKERLMGNVLYDLIKKKESYLLGKYKISKFIFSPKVLSEFPVFDFTEDFISNLKSSYLFQEVLGIKKLDDRIEYWDFAIGYLERKISKIDRNYGHVIHESEDLLGGDERLNKFLLEDKSHITKKVRQVLNFLKITNRKENRAFWQIPEGTVRIELSEEKMLEWLNLFELELDKLSPSDLIEIGLPGFFTIDFLLEDKKENEIEFSRLSSGEQQMILNTNSILYHLFNLESVHQNSFILEEGGFNRVEYTNVNIILDEVELYYHPEMQRRLVANLVDNFERVKSNKNNGIASINVCILTHSPFILSDIPASNVLRLEDGEIQSEQSQTFGANIHELLTNSFFMDSTTGAFAEVKIREIIEFHYKVKLANEIELKILKTEYSEKKEYFNFITNNVGEELIKGVLENHIEFIEDNLLNDAYQDN